VNNDQNQMMNTYFDGHEMMMMMMVVVVKLVEEKPVVVVVALDMDLRKFDNKLDQYKQLDDEDNMVDRNLVFVNDSLRINVHFV